MLGLRDHKDSIGDQWVSRHFLEKKYHHKTPQLIFWDCCNLLTQYTCWFFSNKSIHMWRNECRWSVKLLSYRCQNLFVLHLLFSSTIPTSTHKHRNLMITTLASQVPKQSGSAEQLKFCARITVKYLLL